MSHNELKEYLEAQTKELNHWLDDFIYYTGIELHHDPLNDHSRSEWLIEFIKSDTFQRCAESYLETYEAIRGEQIEL